jgi:WD40 repeat protein
LLTASICLGQPLPAQQVALSVQTGQHSVNDAHFSPDGKYVVTAGDNIAVLWDVATGDEIRAFLGHANTVTSAVFNPSGSEILTVSIDRTIRIWDAATARQKLLLSDPDYRFGYDLAIYSPDGRRILAGGENGTVREWDAQTGALLRRYVTLHARETMPTNHIQIAYLTNGQQMVTGAQDGLIQVWNCGTQQETKRFSWSGHEIAFLTSVPNQNSILVLDRNKMASIWNVSIGAEVKEFEVSRFEALSSRTNAAFSRDGSQLVTVESEVRVWNVATGKMLYNFPQVGDLIPRAENGRVSYDVKTEGIFIAMAGEFAPDGRSLLIADSLRGASLWDLPSKKRIRQFIGQSEDVSSLAFSADGKYMLTSGPHLWDLTTGAVKHQLTGERLSAPSTLSSDGKILYLSKNNRIAAFDTYTGVMVNKFNSLETAHDLAGILKEQFNGGHKGIGQMVASPDGQVLLTSQSPHSGAASPSSSIQVWSATNGSLLGDVDLHKSPYGTEGGITAMAFLPDGKTVLSATRSDVIRMWDVATGKELRSFDPSGQKQRGNGNAPRIGLFELNASEALAVSGDGLLAASGGFWTLHLWNLASGADVRKIDARGIDVSALAISPDGRFVAAGGDDGLIRVWNVASGEKMLEAGRHMGRITALTYYPGGLFLVSASEDGTTRFWDGKDGSLKATLISFKQGQWAVVAPDGRFDTQSLDGGIPLRWVVSSDPMRTLPIEIFMRQYYTPRLLPQILHGASLQPLPSLAELNRAQPRVTALDVEAKPGSAATVRIHVRVAEQIWQGKKSGARDLHVFRDGQLVGLEKGALSKSDYYFDKIPVTDKKRIQFTAYLFNDSAVKSETRSVAYDNQLHEQPFPGHTYALTVGVNVESSGCFQRLNYAAEDARSMQGLLSHYFAKGDSKTLTSEDGSVSGASKTAIHTVLEQFATQVTPKDVFIMTFSGHGYTDKNGRFYLIPSNFSGNCALSDEAALSSAISSDELAQWLMPIDAGQLVLILDACHSAAGVEQGDFKPGPLGNAGLGQLAYDKRMRILVASQSYQEAKESPFGNGLLTTSLLDGLNQGAADWSPTDGKILLREWLRFAVQNVPQLYNQTFRGKGRGLEGQTPALFDFNDRDDDGPLLWTAPSAKGLRL